MTKNMCPGWAPEIQLNLTPGHTIKLAKLLALPGWFFWVINNLSALYMPLHIKLIQMKTKGTTYLFCFSFRCYCMFFWTLEKWNIVMVSQHMEAHRSTWKSHALMKAPCINKVSGFPIPYTSFILWRVVGGLESIPAVLRQEAGCTRTVHQSITAHLQRYQICI